jgi:ribosomal protein L11 methyltransferase
MSYYEFTISIAEPYADVLIQRLMNQGCLGIVEQNESLIAYFPDKMDISIIIKDLLISKSLLEKTDLCQTLTFSYKIIPHQDWNESWKKGFFPIDVGTNFTILPPWEHESAGRINLIVDPSMAFGTGHHETTRSCLVLMEKYARRAARESFLDVGTGTGILAIAAAKLGYQRVVGVDTDILAVDAARLNIILNHTPLVDIREGSISSVIETYDFITANIISGVLIEITPAIAGHLKPGGIAVFSGILDEQTRDVIESVIKAGLIIVEQYPDGKWVSLAATR